MGNIIYHCKRTPHDAIHDTSFESSVFLAAIPQAFSDGEGGRGVTCSRPWIGPFHIPHIILILQTAL